jgi:hypothetical protein
MNGYSVIKITKARYMEVKMNQTYFVLKIDDSMFANGLRNNVIVRKELTPSDAKEIIIDLGWNLTVLWSHEDLPILRAICKRLQMQMPLLSGPYFPLRMDLKFGEKILVSTVSGLRIQDDVGYKYTDDEITSATFSFSMYTVYNRKF